MKSQSIVCPCCGTTYDKIDEAPEFERVEKSGAVNRELIAACKVIESRLDRAGRGMLQCGPAGRDSDWDLIKSIFRAALQKASAQ